MPRCPLSGEILEINFSSLLTHWLNQFVLQQSNLSSDLINNSLLSWDVVMRIFFPYIWGNSLNILTTCCPDYQQEIGKKKTKVTCPPWKKERLVSHPASQSANWFLSQKMCTAAIHFSAFFLVAFLVHHENLTSHHPMNLEKGYLIYLVLVASGFP